MTLNLYTPNLQPELWLHIFRLATISPTFQEFSDFEYEPFSAVLWKARDWFALESTMQVKRALVLVCKYWRAIATEFLMEDVQIRRGTVGLKEGLQRSASDTGSESEGYGHWVRRIELSSSMGDFDPFNPTALVDILKWCTRVQLFVRRYSPSGGDPLSAVGSRGVKGNFPTFSSLKRLDWWFPSGGMPSDGLGFLGDLLRHSPSLHYLSLGNHLSSFPIKKLPLDRISLPALTVLRLEYVDTVLVSAIRGWHLPNVTHVIADPSFFEGRHNILRILGPKLRVVELMQHDKFLDKEFIPRILLGCPNLEEINYHVEFTLPTPFSANCHPHKPVHPKLRCVRLFIAPNSEVRYSGTIWRKMGDGALWSHLVSHFAMFSASAFPALERIVLYGDWESIQEDPRFPMLQSALRRRHCSLELGDGTLL